MTVPLAIETTALTKSFGARKAVDSLDLAVPTGSIYGFLGPNGAGKTTTIRMLVGLAKPSEGGIEIQGVSVDEDRSSVHKHVGVLLDEGGFYPRLSARANLMLLRRLAGDEPDKAWVDQTLERVGLGSRADDRVGTYSHGMHRRLGLAAALVGRRSVLILDEPGNGLDPPGLRDLRNLMQSLRDDGMTIFLSSHLLGEVERVCDQVCILNEGRQVFQGSMTDLTSGATRVMVRIEDASSAERVLREEGWGVEVVPGGVALRGVSGTDINRALAARGLFADSIQDEASALEESFFSLLQVKAEEP